MLLKRMSSWFDIAIALLGAVVFTIGVWWVFPPAGLIVAGVLLVVMAWLRRALELLHEDS